MIKSEKQGHVALFRVAFPYLLASLGYAGLVILLEEFIGDHIYKISGQVGSVLGLAVAFFLGFRMNSAYDRWWEGRKIVGELTNNTRSFANKVYVYIGRGIHAGNLSREQALAEAGDLLELTQAYVLEFAKEIVDFRSDQSPRFPDLNERHGLQPGNKRSNEILIAISLRVDALLQRDSAIEKSDLMQHVTRFYEIQGKAERIKHTPFLMIYSAFTRIIVFGYVILTPLLIGDIDLFGEDSGMELLAIPIMGLIGTAFLTINRLANLYGAPFSKNATALPVGDIVTALVANVEEVRMKCLEVKQ